MELIKKSIKAVIFDMDGTIIHTEQAWKDATVTTLKSYGITEFTPEQHDFLKSLSGTGLGIAATRVKEFFKLPHSVEEIMEQKLTFAEFYLSQDIQFIEGFADFHRRLQAAGMPTSIATNASPETLQKMTAQLKLNEFFGNHMYCSFDVGNKPKPDPAVFLHAAEKLGVAPEHCIVFEDSLVGFNAAQAAGMRCVAVKNDINQGFLNLAHGAIESYHYAEHGIKQALLLPAPIRKTDEKETLPSV